MNDTHLKVGSPLRTWVSLLLVAAVSSAIAGGCSLHRKPARESLQERWARASRTVASAKGPRFDQPEEAAEYARMKRLGGTIDVDPIFQFEAAERHVADMPRYSTRLESFVESVARGGDAAGVSGKTAGSWIPLGPGNIGGRTRVLLIDPRNPNVFFAAGVSGGVWKSLNGGQSWIPLFDPLPNITVNSLVMDPADPDTLLAGTGEGYFREVVRGTGLPLRGAGIFVSRDAGLSWSRLESTNSSAFHWVNDLVISRTDARRIYAATRDGVFRSTDRGQSWERVLDPNVQGGCLDLVSRTDQTADYIFASCGTFAEATVWRNRAAESAAAWEAILDEPGMGRTSLAIAPSDQNVIYALAASNEPGPGGRFSQGLLAVFRSERSGERGSWEARTRNSDPDVVNTMLLTNPLPALFPICEPRTTDPARYITMGWYTNVIAVDPVDPNRVWAGGVDIFRSDDGGRRWGPASYWWAAGDRSFAHADQHAVVFHPSYDGEANQIMYLANDGGIFRTDNALASIRTDPKSVCNSDFSSVVWRALNHDFGVTQFYHGAVTPGGRTYAAGAQDNGTVLGTDEAGINGWRSIFGGDGGYVAFDPRNPDVLYVESQGGNLARSENGGRTFTGAREGLSDSGFLFVTPFTLDPNAPDRLWIGGRQLWKSDDQARTWTAVSRALPGSVSAIAVAPGRSDLVVAGTHLGHVLRNVGALAATSDSTWSVSQPRSGFVSSIAFDPGDANVVYATYAGFGGPHVWKSTDAGSSWTAIDGNGQASIPDIPVHCLVVDPSRPGRIFLGTDLGVFVSLNGGAHWAVENTGFASVATEALALSNGPNGYALFAFTHGRGAWRVDLMAEPQRRRAIRR